MAKRQTALEKVFELLRAAAEELVDAPHKPENLGSAALKVQHASSFLVDIAWASLDDNMRTLRQLDAAALASAKADHTRAMKAATAKHAKGLKAERAIHKLAILDIEASVAMKIAGDLNVVQLRRLAVARVKAELGPGYRTEFKVYESSS